MDYDENDSQGHNHNLAGEQSSRSSVSQSSRWIEDLSRGNRDTKFAAGATDSCSISRLDNVWSEATSSESVEMLLKSVGHEERIQGETIIKKPDAGNESVRLTTEMDPNLQQDGKLDKSQPTALTNYFLDGRNVHALGSQKDNSPVCGSSSDVHSNVPIGVLVSEADVEFIRKCCNTNKMEVDNSKESLVDNSRGFPSDMHVQNVNSLPQSDIPSTTELNGLESKHPVIDTCVKPVDGLLLSDIPRGIMEEQNVRSTESNMFVSAADVAAAAAKLKSDVALAAKLMADELSGNYSQSTGISNSRACDRSRDIACSPMVGEGKISASSIIVAAKGGVRKRAEAASAASKDAQNMHANVRAEMVAETVSLANKILSIGDPLRFRKLVDAGPLEYWRIPQVSSELYAESRVVESVQCRTSIFKELARAEPPKVGETIMAEAIYSDTVTSTEKNSSGTQRAFGTVRDLETNSRTISDVLISGDASKIASGTSLESGMTEGCIVEVSRDSGNCKEAWYSAKILNMKDGKAFVCYGDLQADGGNLKEWVPLKGDGTKGPRIRNAHPKTTMCFDGNKKRRRAAVMDYTWCVGDRVDAWVHDCWLEGVVKEKHKNDETTITIFFPALSNTLHVRTWHLRPSLTWQDGKWIEWPRASGQSPTQVDAPQE